MSIRIKLLDIYEQDDLDDEEEMLSHHLWENAEESSFDVMEIQPDDFGRVMTADGVTSVLEAYRAYADNDRRAIVAEMKMHFDESRIVVMNRNHLIDGNHHFIAAYELGIPVKFIDLEQAINPDESAQPDP